MSNRKKCIVPRYLTPISNQVPILHKSSELAPDSSWSECLDWSERLKNMGVLTDAALIGAFRKIHRYDFLPPRQAVQWGRNHALPIGYNQTNSQPEAVALMLEELGAETGDSVLDFGAGSGWTTALLAERIGRTGRVIGTEVVSQLVKFGNNNLKKYDLPQAAIVHTPDQLGYPEGGPYDRVLVSARIPMRWLHPLLVQLEDGGKLIAPVSKSMHQFQSDGNAQTLMAFTKQNNDFVGTNLHQEVEFVPTVWDHKTW